MTGWISSPSSRLASGLSKRSDHGAGGSLPHRPDSCRPQVRLGGLASSRGVGRLWRVSCVCRNGHTYRFSSVYIAWHPQAGGKRWLGRRSGGLPTHALPPPCGRGHRCEGDLTGPDHESASIRGWSTRTIHRAALTLACQAVHPWLSPLRAEKPLPLRPHPGHSCPPVSRFDLA
jgi:hypothetical protein